MAGFGFGDYVAIAFAVGWLVILEGLLSADNALVLAVIVQHLPPKQQKKALHFGIWGAFVFRLIAVLMASLLIKSWWIQVLGGLYLIFVSVRHFTAHSNESGAAKARFGSGFWGTVANVEIADIAFSIDSILAAVAMAEGLPQHVQKNEQLKMGIIYLGGILGIVAMRFVAGFFLRLLKRFPGLVVGAYLLVAWIGMKLVGEGINHAIHPPGAHGDLSPWARSLPEWLRDVPWEIPPVLFWGGMIAIVLMSLLQREKNLAEPVAHEIEGMEELAKIEDSSDQPPAPDQTGA
jgi:YkoY family integral membrane protein